MEHYRHKPELKSKKQEQVDLFVIDWECAEFPGSYDGQHNVGVYDAARVIADNTRNYFKENPPAGCRWFVTNIDSTSILPTQHPCNTPAPYHIRHDYHIFAGNRYLICNTTVEDITVY